MGSLQKEIRMKLNKNDIDVLRGLARSISEIAALPVQDEKRRLWRKLNSLRPERPMVMIDQVCWNEMDEGELALACTDPDSRRYERYLRRTLYQWNHFRVDMVVEPFIRIPMAISNSGFGVEVHEDTAITDETNDVISHHYNNQFEKTEDLEKVGTPRISHDEEETARRIGAAHEIFEGILDVRSEGIDPYLSLWDPIATWMGVENALYAIIDRPEFMHQLLERMTNGYLSLLDQLEELGLLCGPQSLIHCTGAYSDDLPAPDYDPLKPRAKDLWMFGLAQMFSTVSPAMFKEFEVDYASRICDRFGLVYYGCCDPLDGKMKEVRMIPKVRKVSMSPWTNQERGAAEIDGNYVFSRKPTPALVATTRFDSDAVREDLATTMRICEKYGCAVEFILKDISTVRREPERLTEWSRLAMEVVGG